jgi:hypothetical protein
MALSIGWGMILALLCKWLDSHCGCCNLKGGYDFPVLEMGMLGVMVVISYSELTFGGNLYLLEIMYFAYLMLKL